MTAAQFPPQPGACGTAAPPLDDAPRPLGDPAAQQQAADFLSPFASSFAQHQVRTPGALTPPPEPSSSSSPPRVVGFLSSPTSVVALRRWQSAADPGTAAALEQAAAAEAGVTEPRTAGTFKPPPAGRQSSLGAALKQHEQLAALHTRLSIQTGRPPGSARRRQRQRQQLRVPAAEVAAEPRPRAPALCAPPPSAEGCAPLATAVAKGLEQDWLAALTPASSQLQAAAAAEQAEWSGHMAAVAAAAQAAAAAAGGHLGMPATAASAAGGPFAAAASTLPRGGFPGRAHVSFDVPRQLPAEGLPPGQQLPARQRSSMPGGGSTSIDIPVRNMRRAGTAPALTDDLIAAAIAATSSSFGCASKAPPPGAAAGAAGQPSSGGTSCRSSPTGSGGVGRAGALPRPSERQASCTQELFEAQAEAVAAQTQARVLQQALAQVGLRGRACRGRFARLAWRCWSLQRSPSPECSLLQVGPRPALPASHLLCRVRASRPDAALPLAPVQEQARVAQLQSQLRALLHERSEDRARLQQQEAAHRQLLRVQQAAAPPLQQQAAPAPPPVAVRAWPPPAGAPACPVAAAPADPAFQRQHPAGLPELAAALAALSQ